MKDYKVFVIEGAREQQIIDNLNRVHFKNRNFKIITIPAEQNIYMLWQRMKADSFETDLIEVLRESSVKVAQILEGVGREDISEIFLFFDYDVQQQNLKMGQNESANEVMIQMLQDFNNETENGKLYISYPMVEALRDYTPDYCGSCSKCLWENENNTEQSYKKISAERAECPEFNKFSFQDWENTVNVFAMRVSCLLGEEEVISYKNYDSMVSPMTIFSAQEKYIQDEKILIMSAFPEFLLDYFPVNFWNSCIKHTKILKMNTHS